MAYVTLQLYVVGVINDWHFLPLEHQILILEHNIFFNMR